MNDSAGLQLLKIRGRKQVLIFRMLANETGNVGAKRYYLQLIGASEVQYSTRQSRRNAVAFMWLRHLRVVENNATRKAAIREHSSLPIEVHLKASGPFIVNNGCVVKALVHSSPGGTT